MAFPLRTRRQMLEQRKAALFNERSSWVEHWREIAKYQMPRAGRFMTTEVNKGDKRMNNIHDNTAMYALRTLSAGMMAGMTSPARPWFRLALRDKDLEQFEPVRQWLHDSAQIIFSVFAAGNTYRALHSLYEELGAFGTAASFVMDDFDHVIRLYPMTVGEYALSTNFKGEVDTIVREFKMTVGQLVEEFGIKNVSLAAKNLHDLGNFDSWVDVSHIVEPNRNVERGAHDFRGMAFRSIYIEQGQEDPDKFLKEAGYHSFPALTPRWVVTGNDIYGRSPGMECLGDVKQLQHEQLRKAQGIDYMVNPPLQAPTSYAEHPTARLPGGIFHFDSTAPGQGVRTAFDVNLRLDHLITDIGDVRERINKAYYADLFLMMAQDTRSGITATEVVERHEEKMLMLGPVLERLHNEMLGPLVEGTFQRCSDAGLFGPPPSELEGHEVDVEFISTLAQAQQAIGAGAVDQLVSRVGTLAQLRPEVVDMLNPDFITNDLAKMYGVNPQAVLSFEAVQAVREARAQQEQNAAAMQSAEPMANAVKTMSEVDTDGMGDVQDMFQGYGT